MRNSFLIFGFAVIVLFLFTSNSSFVWARDNFAIQNSIQEKIDNYRTRFSKKGKQPIEVAVQILDASSGKEVFSYNADKLMIPASITKIMTTYAVLKSLDINHKFQTEVYADFTPREGAHVNRKFGKVGDLYVRGHGDPSLVSEIMWDWTNTLKDLGITEIDNIVIDDSLFINPHRALGWEAYNAGLSATSLNFNTYTFKITPTIVGEDSVATATVGLPIQIENNIKTELKNNIKMQYVPFSSKHVERNGMKQLEEVGKIIFTGSIKEGTSQFVNYRAFPDDIAGYYGHSFAYFLRLNGINVRGDIFKGVTPSSAKKIITFKSKPLSNIISDLNKFSNNFIASQLIYALGKNEQGYYDFDLGRRELASILQVIGIAPDTYTITDGSGLDVKNRLTASQITRVLFTAGNDASIAPTFMDSFAKFNMPNCTLSKRSVFFRRAKDKKLDLNQEKCDLKQVEQSVWAKTGTLTGTSSLAGFFTALDGKNYIFTIISNGPVSKADAGEFEEEIIGTLILGLK